MRSVDAAAVRGHAPNPTVLTVADLELELALVEDRLRQESVPVGHLGLPGQTRRRGELIRRSARLRAELRRRRGPGD